MQTTLETSPSHQHVILVTLSWGSSSGADFPHVARYVRSETDLVLADGTFLAEPALTIFADKAQDGGVEDAPMDVQMPVSRAPFDTLSRPTPHAKVTVLIEEMDPTDASTRQDVFYGRLSKIVVNPSGRGRLARAKIAGAKSRLKTALGMQALSTCAWTFGDWTCAKDLDAISLEGTIEALASDDIASQITATFEGTPDLSNERWARGYVEVDGLRILIRQVLTGGKFQLREIPPAAWANATATFVPGCSKTIGSCTYWGNVVRFGGFGIKMPDRNPVFEEA